MVLNCWPRNGSRSVLFQLSWLNKVCMKFKLLSHLLPILSYLVLVNSRKSFWKAQLQKPKRLYLR